MNLKKWFMNAHNRRRILSCETLILLCLSIALIVLFLYAGIVFLTWTSRLHSGGGVNVLMPLYAFFAIFFGISAHWIFSLSCPSSQLDHSAPPGLFGKIGPFLIIPLLILQLTILMYRPDRYIPTRADAAQGGKLMKTLSALEGELFIPSHGYLAVRAGKRTNAHLMAVLDVLRSGDNSTCRKFEQDFFSSIRARQYSYIVLDDVWDDHKYTSLERIKREITLNYEYQENLWDHEEFFYTRTGLKTRPDKIYRRKTN